MIRLSNLELAKINMQPLEDQHLYAIAFGTDGTFGDSLYYADPQDAIPCEKEATFGQLKQRMMEAQSLTEEDCEDLAGFWIVSKEHIEAISAVWGDDIPGNDSALYRLNAAAKRLASHLAAKTVRVNG